MTQENAFNFGEVKHFPLFLKHTTLYSLRLVFEHGFDKDIVRKTKHHETPSDKYCSATNETNYFQKQSYATILSQPLHCPSGPTVAGALGIHFSI
jgi:hypothetical protein